MSADNGYVIRRNDEGAYVLQMYFASNDEYPPIDAPGAMYFDTLEEAADKYDAMENETGYLSEYGLTIDVPSDKISISRETAEVCLRLVEQFPVLREGSVATELTKALED